MNTLSASSEQAYYKLLAKEKEIRRRIEIEEEAVAQIPENSYMLGRFSHSVEFQAGRLEKLKSTYEKERAEIEEKYKRSLEKLETTYDRDTKEITAKLQKAEEDLTNEKTRLKQTKKSKTLIRAEHELEFVLKQKELILPTAKPVPAPVPVPQPAPEPKKVETPTPQPPSNTKPINPFLEAEEKRALENVQYQIQVAEREARDRRRAEEEKKEKDREAFLLNQRLQEEADERRRKERMEELKKLPPGTNPFAPKSVPKMEDEEEEEDDWSDVDEDALAAAKAKLAALQRPKPKPTPSFYTPPVPVEEPKPQIVANTKQKKSIKSVSFRG